MCFQYRKRLQVCLLNFVSVFFLLLIPFAAKSQCGVTIVPDKKVICVPGKVTLVAKGCTTCTGYEWDLGNGWVPAGDTFSALVAVAGKVDVRLRVRYAGGNSCVATLQDVYAGRDNPKPLLRFSSRLQCSEDDSVQVADVTPYSASRDWLIDGKYIRRGEASLYVQFRAPWGYKPVFVTVRDSFGCVGSLYMDSAVGAFRKVKLAVQPNQDRGCLPRSIQYRLLADTFEQQLRSLRWRFSGGSPVSSLTRLPPPVTYTRPGQYGAMAEAVTDAGCSYAINEDSIVRLGDSIHLALRQQPGVTCLGSKVVYEVLGSRTGQTVWEWSPPAVQTDSLGTGKKAVSFQDSGFFSLVLREDSFGCSVERRYKNLIRTRPPLARMHIATPAYCSLPDTLRIENRSLESDTGTTAYEWTVFSGDTQVLFQSGARDIAWIPKQLQNWHVRLIAKGSNGCTDTLMQHNAIVGMLLDVQVSKTPNPACPNQKMLLQPDPVGTSRKQDVKYDWAIWNRKQDTLSRSKLTAVRWSSPDTGRFSFRVIAWTPKGCRDTLFGPDSLKVYNPEILPHLGDSFVCRNEPFFLFSKVRQGSSTAIRYWEGRNTDSGQVYKFASEDTARLQLPRHGRYRFRLFYSDTANGGCQFILPLPERVFVSGPAILATANPMEDCIPFQSVLQARLVKDVDFEKRRNPAAYQWTEKYPLRSVIDSQRMRTTTTLFRESQFYSFICRGASGCADTVKDLRLQGGVVAYFELANNGKCRGDTFRLRNRSTATATHFYWDCSDSSIRFFPSPTAREPWFVASRSGLFNIRLITTNQHRCYDTFSNVVRVDSIRADFYAVDSVSYCAPKIIELTNTSHNSRFSRWSFSNNPADDLLTIDKAKAIKLLVRNSVGGVSVTLRVRSRLGCEDSLTRNQYLRIIGPEADVYISKVSGCEPFVARFENRSSFFKQVILDYGDGSVTDSFGITHHAYGVRNKASNYQVYYPTFALYDSLGCRVIEKIKDSVLVFKGPEAQFTTDLRQGCSPLTVRFINRTLFYRNLRWEPEGNGNSTSADPQPVWEFTQAGRYRPKLYAVNENGCSDSFVLPYEIVVFPSPNAAFVMSADSTCYHDTVYFRNRSYGLSPIVKYAWDFGDETRMDDLSGSKDSRWAYPTPNNKKVRLTITDSLGCSSVSIRNLHVHDTMAPVHMGLSHVTFLADNQTVAVYWKPYTASDFLAYHLYRDSAGYYFLQRFRNANENTWFTQLSNSSDRQNHCFALRTEDTCNIKNGYGISQCTILTQALRPNQSPFVLQVRWTPYNGWLNLSHYEVYRSESGAAFKHWRTVKPWQLEVYDSALCDKTYCYYVVGVSGDGLRSRSNETCARPLYLPPAGNVPVNLATVHDSRRAFVRWEPYEHYLPGGRYHVFRSDLQGTSEIGQCNTTTFVDRTARVNEQAYTYRVSYTDHCGARGTVAGEGTTIFLRGSIQQDDAHLEWTPYRSWTSGIAAYLVQLRGADGKFHTRAVIPANLQSWKDHGVVSSQSDSLVYRVLAVKDGPVPDTSTSNYRALVPTSRLFVPTAFSPNGDGFNDRFGARALFVVKGNAIPKKSFLLEIYNRWGQLVFRSNHPDMEWDGTFMGAQCPDGAYVYRVKAVGFDGILHVQEGSVMLIR